MEHDCFLRHRCIGARSGSMMWRRWRLKRVSSRDRVFPISIDTGHGRWTGKVLRELRSFGVNGFFDASMDLRAFGGLGWGCWTCRFGFFGRVPLCLFTQTVRLAQVLMLMMSPSMLSDTLECHSIPIGLFWLWPWKCECANRSPKS